MQYFIEIFTPTKFHEILHHYYQCNVRRRCNIQTRIRLSCTSVLRRTYDTPDIYHPDILNIVTSSQKITALKTSKLTFHTHKIKFNSNVSSIIIQTNPSARRKSHHTAFRNADAPSSESPDEPHCTRPPLIPNVPSSHGSQRASLQHCFFPGEMTWPDSIRTHMPNFTPLSFPH